MGEKKYQENERVGFVEVAMSRGLISLATLATVGAFLRVLGPAATTFAERLDQTTLLYLVVAGVLLMLRHIKTFSMGQLKFEMIEKLRERQDRQEERLADIALILPFLLPEQEVRHIKNMAAGATAAYRGSHSVRTELRRLRSSGLLLGKPNKRIGDITDGKEVDLADYLELTTLGRKWAATIHELEAAEVNA